MQKEKILVTGGAGFIGSQVNEQLHQEGYDTVVLDNLSTGNKKAVLHGEFVEGDLNNRNLLEEIFTKQKITGVMHFAASIDVGESVLNPSRYYINNVCNLVNLLDAMRKFGVNHIIFSSSAAVYGIPDNGIARESDPCWPINPYGETKLIGEKILRDYHAAYGLNTCSLRYFNAAGGDPKKNIKNYKQNESNLIPVILNCIKKNTVLTVNGSDYDTFDGTCVRDYIHVADLGLAHILAMKKLLKEGGQGCYNLGNGRGFSILEVIKAAEDVTGRKVSFKEGPRRAGDPPSLLANAEKAAKELAWSPRYPDLKTIINDAWEAKT